MGELKNEVIELRMDPRPNQLFQGRTITSSLYSLRNNICLPSKHKPKIKLIFPRVYTSRASNSLSVPRKVPTANSFILRPQHFITVLRRLTKS
jgi:hypothetical protein